MKRSNQVTRHKRFCHLYARRWVLTLWFGDPGFDPDREIALSCLYLWLKVTGRAEPHARGPILAKYSDKASVNVSLTAGHPTVPDPPIK